MSKSLDVPRVLHTLLRNQPSPSPSPACPAPKPQPSHIPQPLNPKETHATDLKAPSECSFRRRRNLTGPSPCAHSPLKPSSDQLTKWRISTFCYFFVVFFSFFLLLHSKVARDGENCVDDIRFRRINLHSALGNDQPRAPSDPRPKTLIVDPFTFPKFFIRSPVPTCTCSPVRTSVLPSMTPAFAMVGCP